MATATQEIIITPLPAGVSENSGSILKVTLHFAPRLVSEPGNEVLSAFPDWVDWPSLAGRLKPRLILSNGTAIELEPDPDSAKPSSDIWKRLFADDCYVRPYAYTKLLGRRIRSFSLDKVSRRIANMYGDLISEPSGQIPEAAQVDQLFGTLSRIDEPSTFERLNKLTGSQFGDLGTLIRNRNTQGGFASTDELEFFLTRRFYKRPKNAQANPYKEAPDPNFASAPIIAPKLDFHQGIAAVGDFPALLRLLGLAVDFQFRVPQNFPATGSFTVDPGWPERFPTTPVHKKRDPLWTHYKRAKQLFVPLSAKGSDFQDGYLDIRKASDNPHLEVPPPFVLSQVDVDGGALKTLDYSANVANRQKLSNYRTPRQWAAPTLRTTGISIARNERDQSLAKSLLASDKLNARFTNNQKVELYAEDLVRGYRLDVLDLDAENSVWRSLCERKGRYVFESNQGDFHLDLDDEGYVKSASTSGESNGSTDLYLHERMFSFEGWSLVAPRPGKALAADPSQQPVEPRNESVDLPLTTHFRPEPGSLPKLRFGRRYKLRVRLVDIAGNGLALSDRNEDYVSETLHYKRFEPVLSPTLVPRTFYGEGESLEHMVIRSDYDRTPAQYAADPEVVSALANWQHTYSEFNDRHIAPPKTSQQDAELHGMFDAFIGSGNDPQKGFFLASRESGNFFHTEIVNLSTGLPEPLPDANLQLFTPAGTIPTDLANLKPGDPLKEGEYIVRAEEQLITPYLPDPMAHGVALRNLPGDPDGIHLVEFGGEWPDIPPFRIRIVERAGALQDCELLFAQAHEPEWDAEKNILSVFLEKGCLAEVAYSSYIDPERIDSVGITKWAKIQGDAFKALEDRIITGGHWMTTPWRTLTLVHATQRPLCPPRCLTLTQTRPQKGNTFAYLRGTARANVPTTGQLDLLANWKEPIDDLTQDGPSELASDSHVVQMQVSPSSPNDHPIPSVTGRGKKATPIIHEFGDTKHRIIDYRLKGTTRFREYLPPEINKFDFKISRIGLPFSLSIPSSARPIAPSVVDILPAFEWSEAALEGGGVRRTRKGNTLRVYLKRPWYSSGEGELLGVVYNTPVAASVSQRPNLTEWGLDPMFDGPIPNTTVDAKRFPSKVANATKLSLPSTGDTLPIYGVSGHEVHYDTERQLWYSDIEFSCGSSYFPMVRLALARYQPDSISNAHLSSVARTEFAQLVPDRTAVLQPLSVGKHSFKLFGVAPTETYLSKTYGKSPRLAASLGPDMVAGDDEVPPFSKPGLNRYEVRAEYLPAGASPDFGWKKLSGLTIRKPGKKAVIHPAKISAIPAKKITPINQPRLTRILSANTSINVGNVARKPGLESITDLLKTIQPKPLWAADLEIPAAPAGARRRLTIEEFELHLHEAEELNPDASKRTVRKRLVYADILPL